MGLLDHALPLLRAKGILSVVLLCRWGAAEPSLPGAAECAARTRLAHSL